MIKLKQENQNTNKTFLSISTFKNSQIQLEEDFLNNNSLIKGARKTGKTEKVLLPAFSSCKNGALYIDYEGESENLVIELSRQNHKKLNVFINKTLDIKKAIHFLENGENVYFNVRSRKKNKEDLNNLNTLLDKIETCSNEFQNKINIFIDNAQFVGRLESLTHLVENDSNAKVFITMTLSYTSQLKDFYSEEEIEIIKEHSISYDVEKQY